MKLLLFFILFSSLSYANEFEILNSGNIKLLFEEIANINKKMPVKDPFMKQLEYEELIKKAKLEIAGEKKTYALSINLTVPCNEYSRFCYEVEKENFVINNGKIYEKDFTESFNRTINSAEYKGQTILQKNLDKETNILEMNSYEERLFVRDDDKEQYLLNQKLDTVKKNFDSYNLYLVFDINPFDKSHKTTYTRYQRIPPTIDNPTDSNNYSKDIYGDFKYFSLFYKGDEILRTPGKYHPKFIPEIENLHKTAVKKDINGYVEVKFLIGTNGETKNHKIIDSKCQYASIDMIQKMYDGILDITRLRKSDFSGATSCKTFNKSALKTSKKLKYDQRVAEVEGSYIFFYVGASGGFAYRNIDFTKYNENNPDQQITRRQ